MSSPLCLRLDELLAGRDADRLSAADASLLRRHLDDCAGCAARALGRDPVLLFARGAGPEPLSAAERERFVGGVLASVAAARAARRGSVSPFRAHAALRLAASILLAVTVAGGWWAWRREATAPAGAPVARAAVPAVSSVGPSEAVPAVEEISSGEAVVYQFPATEPGEPTVVFLVDHNADI